MADACLACRDDFWPHRFVHEWMPEHEASVAEMLKATCDIGTTADDFLCKDCYPLLEDAFAFRNTYRANQQRKPTMFRCHKCTYTTHLEQDLKTHGEVKAFACDKCDYRTCRRSDFKRHELVHSEVRAYACDKCDYKTKHRGALKGHLLIHDTKKVFACDRCDYKTHIELYFKRHTHTHETTRLFSCEKCAYKTNYRRNFNKHKRTHEKARLFACEKCSYKTQYGAKLRTHIVRYHETPKTYTCNECEYATNRLVRFRKHLTVHPGIVTDELISATKLKTTTGIAAHKITPNENPVRDEKGAAFASSNNVDDSTPHNMLTRKRCNFSTDSEELLMEHTLTHTSVCNDCMSDNSQCAHHI